MLDDSPKLPPDDLVVDYGKKEATDPKRIADFRRQEDERWEQQKRERYEKARRDAIAAFLPQPADPRSIGPIWTCPGCGALVLDRDRHLDFHSTLAQTAADASEAAWRGRPIG
jgi:hypothetical protein